MVRPTITLDDENGTPVKIQVAVRQSETMPSRIKVHFRTDVRKTQATTPDGNVVKVATERGALCPEFRLEMN